MNTEKLREKILEAEKTIKNTSKTREQKQSILTGIVDCLTSQLPYSTPDDSANRETISSAIGHIYIKAEQAGLTIDPIYKQIIPGSSKYFTGKDSGRISKLLDKPKVPLLSPSKEKRKINNLKQAIKSADLEARRKKQEKIEESLEELVKQLSLTEDSEAKQRIKYAIGQVYKLAKDRIIPVTGKYLSLIPTDSDYFLE